MNTPTTVQVEQSKLCAVQWISVGEILWIVACVMMPWNVDGHPVVAWFFVDGQQWHFYKGFRAYFTFLEAHGPYKTVDEAHTALREFTGLTVEESVDDAKPVDSATIIVD